MKFKSVFLASLSVAIMANAGMAHANEVLLTASQPMSITYKIAQKSHDGRLVLSELQHADMSRNVHLSIDLGNYEKVGVVITSIDGHVLPDSANQFDKTAQCSMTTDKVKPAGALEMQLEPHKATCRIYGGVFG